MNIKDLNVFITVAETKHLTNASKLLYMTPQGVSKIIKNLESECDIALQQIDDRMYAKEYEDDYNQILCYGISFFKKRCMVKKK